MAENKVFFKCTVCESFAVMVENTGPKMMCCGQEMKLVAVNNVDFTSGKYVLSVNIKKDEVLAN